MHIDVLTCIIGDYDNLRPPLVKTPGVRWICYADEPHFDSGWEIQPARLRYQSPSRNSRIPKILSHFHSGSEFTIWMDACLQPRVDLTELVDLLGSADILGIRHPRTNAVTELEYCIKEAAPLGFVNRTAHMSEQVKSYQADGWTGEPFICGGILLRRNNAAVRAFNELWWAEYVRWCAAGQPRDQFSLNYAIWKSGIAARIMTDHHIHETPWFAFKGHAAFPNFSDNPLWAPNRKRRSARRETLERLLDQPGGEEVSGSA